MTLLHVSEDGRSIALACGCTAAVIGDELHAFPCSTQHEQMLTAAAEFVAAEAHVEFEIRHDLDRPCVMHPVDDCSLDFPCADCPRSDR